MRDGTDATVIACGLEVGNALAAAEILKAQGVSLRVVDMFCIKPLDEEMIVRCAEETGAVITAEEHNLYGGLGGAVCEAICRRGGSVKYGMIGICDTHTECGPYAALQKKYGIDAEAISRKVLETLRR